MAGALPEAEWAAVLMRAGFEDVRVGEPRWDSFRGAPKESADALELGAECVTLSARKRKTDEREVKGFMDSNAPRADAVLDASGSACANLTPMIRARIRELASGQVLEVHSDDPAAREGVPAWSRLTGNLLEAVVEEDAERTRFYLKRK